jgi:negative regulator of flagellin synthesis FlgM
MDVTSTGSVAGAGAVQPVQLSAVQSAETAPVAGLESPRDEVSISSAARLLEQARVDPNVRAERLAEIHTAIANGTYETPAKLEAAVERLLDEIRRSSR